MRRDGQHLGRRLLVQGDGRLDRADQAGVRLEPRDLGVVLGAGGRALGDQVAQGAREDAVLPQARQHAGDVVQVGPVRTDDEHPSPAPAHPRVGVHEVGGAVEGDDRLARARPAVHDERPARPGPDHRVLVGLDGAEHVAHPLGPGGAEAGHERRLVVERGVALQPLGGEDLVPVVPHPAACPAVPAPADQAHRPGVGGAEERLGRGRAPVDQQAPAGAVAQAEPADVDRLGPALGDHAPQAQVGAVAAQGAQPRPEPAHLEVAVHGLLAAASRSAQLGLQAVRQLRDGPLQGGRDRGQVALVRGDERRVRLGRQAGRQVEDTGADGVHGGRLRVARRCGGGRASRDRPPRRGSCRKSPAPLYVEKEERSRTPRPCQASWPPARGRRGADDPDVHRRAGHEGGRGAAPAEVGQHPQAHGDHLRACRRAEPPRPRRRRPGRRPAVRTGRRRARGRRAPPVRRDVRGRRRRRPSGGRGRRETGRVVMAPRSAGRRSPRVGENPRPRRNGFPTSATAGPPRRPRDRAPRPPTVRPGRTPPPSRTT